MLYHKSGNSYSELIEIKDVPDMGSDPELIEVTTLKRKRKVYVSGREDSPIQNFTYNYTETNYTTVKTICDNVAHEFLVKYSDGTGTYIKGIPTTRKSGVTQNSAVEAILSIVPEDIQDKTSAEVTALLGA